MCEVVKWSVVYRICHGYCGYPVPIVHRSSIVHHVVIGYGLSVCTHTHTRLSFLIARVVYAYVHLCTCVQTTIESRDYRWNSVVFFFNNVIEKRHWPSVRRRRVEKNVKQFTDRVRYSEDDVGGEKKFVPKRFTGAFSS